MAKIKKKNPIICKVRLPLFAISLRIHQKQYLPLVPHNPKGYYPLHIIIWGRVDYKYEYNTLRTQNEESYHMMVPRMTQQNGSFLVAFDQDLKLLDYTNEAK